MASGRDALISGVLQAVFRCDTHQCVTSHLLALLASLNDGSYGVVCVCVCVCVCVYAHICTYIYVHTCTCTYIYKRVYTCVCVCVYASVAHGTHAGLAHKSQRCRNSLTLHTLQTLQTLETLETLETLQILETFETLETSAGITH